MLYIRQNKLQEGVDLVTKALELDPKCEAVGAGPEKKACLHTCIPLISK